MRLATFIIIPPSIIVAHAGGSGAPRNSCALYTGSLTGTGNSPFYICLRFI